MEATSVKSLEKTLLFFLHFSLSGFKRPGSSALTFEAGCLEGSSCHCRCVTAWVSVRCAGCFGHRALLASQPHCGYQPLGYLALASLGIVSETTVPLESMGASELPSPGHNFTLSLAEQWHVALQDSQYAHLHPSPAVGSIQGRGLPT